MTIRALLAGVALAIPLFAQPRYARERLFSATERLAVATSAEDANSAAAERMAALYELAASDPRTALEAAAGVDFLGSMARRWPAIRPMLESRDSWVASLDVIVADDFGVHRSEVSYRLRSSEGMWAVYAPRGVLPDVSGIARVAGIRVGNRIAAGNAQVVSTADDEQECAPVGEQRVAVLLATWPGTPPLDTVENMRARFFGGALSLTEFWKTSSYGKTWASGDIFGWYTLDREYNCKESGLMEMAVIHAAEAAGVDLSRYRRIYTVANLAPGDCREAGWGSVGCGHFQTPDGRPYWASVTWVNGLHRYYDPISAVSVLTHEGGHNLGLSHSRSRRYDNEPLGSLGDPGTVDEYGDFFSNMGNGVLGHYSARQKRWLGWLSEDQVVNVKDPGVYRISSLQVADGLPKALRVPRGSDGWLWVEYRQPSDVFEAANAYRSLYSPLTYAGAQIFYEGASPADLTFEHTGYCAYTDLLDMTPGSNNDLFYDPDPMLSAGKNWSDPYTSTSIRVLDDDGSNLTVSVNESAPCVTLPEAFAVLQPGAGDGSIAVTGPSGCAWTAVSTAPWLTIVDGAQRTGAGTLHFHADPNQSSYARKAVVAIGATAYRLTQFPGNQTPGPFVVNPSSARGTSSVFQLSWSDPNGWEDVGVARLRIGEAIGGCLVEYDVQAKTVQITGGAASAGPKPVGTGLTALATPNCMLDRFDVAMAADRATLRTTVNVILRSPMIGTQAIYMSARDRQGADSAWTKTGSMVVTQDQPSTVTVTPGQVSRSAQTLQLRVTDNDGAADILEFTLRLIVNAARRECQLRLWRDLNVKRWLLSVVDTAGGYDGGVVGGEGVLQAPACNVDLTHATVTESPTSVELVAPLTMKAALTGSLDMHVSVVNGSHAVTDTSMGKWIVPSVPVPQFSASGVTNGASFAPGAISPGELVTIFGFNLGPPQIAVSSYDSISHLPTVVGDTRVIFDDVAAPLVYAMDRQVSVIAPYSLVGKSSTRIRVEVMGQLSPAIDVPVVSSAPGIFAQSDGPGNLVAINEDGSINSQNRPAAQGSTITFFATGVGQTSPGGIDGRMPLRPEFPEPVLPVGVTFAGQEGRVDFKGMIFAGVMQVNVHVPADAPSGQIPLLLWIGEQQSQARGALWIR